jgi:hypothetical protein
MTTECSPPDHVLQAAPSLCPFTDAMGVGRAQHHAQVGKSSTHNRLVQLRQL